LTKILIIGLGRIGFYHFQSLLKSKSNLKLDCIDISKNKINKVKNYVKKLKNHKKIRLLNSFEKIDKKYDFLIHATNADVRLKTLQKVLSLSEIKFGILEKNLSGSLIELRKFYDLNDKFKKCWVNTFRHESTIWKKFKKKVKIDNISLIEFRGVQGLACNAIHAIDLVSSWKKKLPLSIEISNLEKWYKSKKRIGFIDFHGEIEVIFPDNLRLLIRGHQRYEDLICHVHEKSKKWTLSEINGTFFCKTDKINAKFEYQSEMTSKLIKKIIKYGDCDLPRLNWSIKCHDILLKTLLKNWNIWFNTSYKKIPIT
tara:strand:+ start:5835 stop:6773 length:939 start_codon:yes stop_codon:yes gene_type:complete